MSSTAYCPAANGLAEAFNKTIGKLLKKFISKSQRDRDEKFGKYIWVYRIMLRTSTKATPFSIVHDAKPYYHWRFKFYPMYCLGNRYDTRA